MVVSQTTSTIRAARLRRGLTLRALAEQCAAEGVSVHYSQLGKIEAGKNTPRPALRAAIAKVLELDALDLEQAAS